MDHFVGRADERAVPDAEMAASTSQARPAGRYSRRRHLGRP
ncbi:MAG TPA: hypothetical protein VIJ82_30505 [Streptosporangiaceae bacterium]